MKQVHIATFGCQMNDQDSRMMAQILAGYDYEVTDRIDQADLILVNTCSIRQKAEDKTYSLLGRLKRLKTINPRLVIGVGGCVAQQEGEKLLEKVPYLDLVFGTKLIPRLPEMIRGVEEDGIRLARTDLLQPLSYPVLPDSRKSPFPPIKASVTIMQGCNNYCTYCVVPFVRGREESRSSREILSEVKTLVNQGVKEILLLGQNVNSYGQNRPGELTFARLLGHLEEISGLERIRFTTSHPKDLSRELTACFGQLSKLCEHIHLPVQAGSNAILGRMNRRYTREIYLEKIQALRERYPTIAVTSDVIVGFPGETRKDFEQTLELLQAVRFDDLFSFKYSDRPLTRARLFPDQVEAEEKGRRLKKLQAFQKEVTLARNKALEGTVQSVLVDGLSKKSPFEWTGRTRTNKVVNFSGPPELLGRTLPVKIEKATLHSLKGSTQLKAMELEKVHGN